MQGRDIETLIHMQIVATDMIKDFEGIVDMINNLKTHRLKLDSKLLEIADAFDSAIHVFKEVHETVEFLKEKMNEVTDLIKNN